MKTACITNVALSFATEELRECTGNVLHAGIKKSYHVRAARLAAAFEKERAEGQEDPEAANVDAVKAEQTRAMYTAASLTFEAGIIFHSIFIGLTYGIVADPTTLHALSIALCFHQVRGAAAHGS